jgi:hypothetical protein
MKPVVIAVLLDEFEVKPTWWEPESGLGTNKFLTDHPALEDTVVLGLATKVVEELETIIPTVRSYEMLQGVRGSYNRHLQQMSHWTQNCSQAEQYLFRKSVNALVLFNVGGCTLPSA